MGFEVVVVVLFMDGLLVDVPVLLYLLMLRLPLTEYL